jgi:hypothetical protein
MPLGLISLARIRNTNLIHHSLFSDIMMMKHVQISTTSMPYVLTIALEFQLSVTSIRAATRNINSGRVVEHVKVNQVFPTNFLLEFVQEQQENYLKFLLVMMLHLIQEREAPAALSETPFQKLVQSAPNLVEEGMMTLMLELLLELLLEQLLACVCWLDLGCFSSKEIRIPKYPPNTPKMTSDETSICVFNPRIR